VLAGCADYSVFDLHQQIDVSPVGTWTDLERAYLDAAPVCWNLGFGIDYAVTAEATTYEHVDVELVEFLCLGDALGQYTAGLEGHIALCPYDFEHATPSRMFFVIAHELGHAAGIRVEGAGQQSLMGLKGDNVETAVDKPMFTDEDRALFAAAQPDFVPAPVCDPVARFHDETSTWTCECP
jgi:hypothetical protein